MNPTEKAYSVTQGTRLLEALFADGKYIFDIHEATSAASSLMIPTERVKALLSGLVKGGWLIRIKRGLYTNSGKLATNELLHPYAIATRLVTPSAISHWTAMNYHHLTEQLPFTITAMTTQKVYPPSLRDKEAKTTQGKHAWEIQGDRYEYVTVKPGHFFGVEQVWIDQMSKIPITDKERTILEGFAFPSQFGSLREILGILEENSNKLDIPKLIDYTLQYDAIAPIKRVGWALDTLGISPKKLQPLKEYPATGYRLLDPTGPKKGSYDSKWMIQNNLKA